MQLLLVLIPLALFYNTLGNGFISGDDYTGFIQNTAIRDIWATIKTYQLNHVYFALIYKYAGASAFYLHLFSVVFHILVVLLVYKCFQLAFDKKNAFVTALLFSVHPIVTETIDWISATPYLFNALVAFGTLFLYLKFKKTSRRSYLFLATSLFAFSAVFFRSPWILTTPIIVTFFELFITRTIFSFSEWKAYLKNLWPFYLISLFFFIFSVVGLIAVRQQVLKTEYFSDNNPPDPIHIRLIYPTFMTIKLLVVPTNLTLYHEGEIISQIYMAWMVMVSIGYIIGTIILWKFNRRIASILTLIFLILLPVYIPQINTWMVAERYLYIPAVFFCFLVTRLFFLMEEKSKIKYLSYLLISMLVAFYFLASFQRNSHWKNNKTFWLKTTEASPQSFRAFNNAGDAFATDNDLGSALKYFQKAVEIKNDYAEGWHNIGFTYMQMNELQKAKNALIRAFQINPQLYQASYKLGYIEYTLGNKEAAKNYIDTTLKIKPGYEPALQTMVMMSLDQGQN